MSTNSEQSKSGKAPIDEETPRLEPPEGAPPPSHDDIEPEPEELGPIGGPVREPQGLWHFKRADRL